MCTMMLADLGASIVKLEPLERGDDARALKPPEVAGESGFFLSANRNKKSVGLDIRTAAGREVFFELAAKCLSLIHI